MYIEMVYGCLHQKKMLLWLQIHISGGGHIMLREWNERKAVHSNVIWSDIEKVTDSQLYMKGISLDKNEMGLGLWTMVIYLVRTEEDFLEDGVYAMCKTISQVRLEEVHEWIFLAIPNGKVRTWW